MEKMLGYCGLNCGECPAYLATQAGDSAALEEVAAQWSQQFGQSITAADCVCDGCATGGERKGSYCGQCEIRACAVGHDVPTCAHCDDYGCDKLTGFLMHVPEAKATLEGIRAGL